ncbi:MAG: hypothetical protein K2G21_06095 [Muribaculaceae bacterium]|nr:hypothetical protein [Muribaculaceae bacterium]
MSRLLHFGIRLIISFVVILSSCCNNSIENEIKNFKSQKIDLKLDELQLLTGEIVSSNSKKLKLVVYTDSTECTSCRIFQMYLWNDFLEKTLSVKDSIDVLFVFNTTDDINVDVIKDISPYLHGARLYLDSLGTIKNNNEYFPKSNDLHTFLLDRDNNVILIGDPIKNVAIEDLYNKVFAQLFDLKK